MSEWRDSQGGGAGPRPVIAWLLAGSLAMAGMALPVHAQVQAQTDPGVVHPSVMPVADIDWTTVAQAYKPEQQETYDRLDGFVAQQRAFDATAVPILMPGARSGISLSRMTFSSFGDAYGMALPQPRSDSDVTIVITATRSFVAAAPGTIDPANFETLNVGGQPVQAEIEPTEGGWTASFARYGALYSVDIDCGDQGAASPCQNADYIRQVTASLGDVALGKLGQDRITGIAAAVAINNGDRLGPPDRRHRRPENRFGPYREPEPRHARNDGDGDRPQKVDYPVKPPVVRTRNDGDQGKSGSFMDWLRKAFTTPPAEKPVNGQDVR